MTVVKDVFRSPLSLLLFFGTTVVGLVLDLWTKTLALHHLAGEPPRELIPHWLHFTYVENHGAVFGLGQGQRWLFVLVSFLAIGFLTYLFALSAGRRFYQFLLGVLLAGVLGNMYDRVTYGYVRDMIHALPGFFWPNWMRSFLPPAMANGGVFPWVFNVADMLLCVGVFLMIVYSFLHRPVESAKLNPQPSADEPG
jgi:signal peptidase II